MKVSRGGPTYLWSFPGGGVPHNPVSFEAGSNNNSMRFSIYGILNIWDFKYIGFSIYWIFNIWDFNIWDFQYMGVSIYWIFNTWDFQYMWFSIYGIFNIWDFQYEIFSRDRKNNGFYRRVQKRRWVPQNKMGFPERSYKNPVVFSSVSKNHFGFSTSQWVNLFLKIDLVKK